MSPALAQRVLALPADVRATLAGVPGPGWRVHLDHKRSRPRSYACSDVHELCGWPVHAWWPANPAAAVAAVIGCPLFGAHHQICMSLRASGDDDHTAALSIIEAHVAQGGK